MATNFQRSAHVMKPELISFAEQDHDVLKMLRRPRSLQVDLCAKIFPFTILQFDNNNKKRSVMNSPITNFSQSYQLYLNSVISRCSWPSSRQSYKLYNKICCYFMAKQHMKVFSDLMPLDYIIVSKT